MPSILNVLRDATVTVLLFGMACFAQDAKSPAPERPAPAVLKELNDLVAREDYLQLRKRCEELLKRFPNDLGLLAGLANLEMRLNDLDASQKTIERALTIAPQDDNCHVLNGYIQYNKNQLKEALDSWRMALRLNSRNKTAETYIISAFGSKALEHDLGDYLVPRERLKRLPLPALEGS
jgi:tetratricopeptide (TPR) repeat protein